MNTVNFNRASYLAGKAINASQKRINKSLQRLSTGLRINGGSDDPSGLIASESLKSESLALHQGITNAERAGNVIGTAEGALTEIGTLLASLQSLVTQSANSGAVTPDERAAAQQEIDSTLGQITGIAGTTSFNGKKLLDGSLAYKTTGVVATSLTDVAVNAAKVAPGTSKTLNIAVQTAATRARVDYTGGTLAAGNNVTLEVGGNSGVKQISFAAGTTIAAMATSINATTGDTGIQATVAGTTLQFESAIYGSSQGVAVRAVSGTYATTAPSANGTDAVVRVNGGVAGADGTKINYRDGDTDLSFSLTATSNVAAAATTFNVSGGGASFLIGSDVTEANRYSIGLQSVATTSLGNSTLGFLSTLRSGETNSLSTGNYQQAQKIADAAVGQVAELRGRLGLFQTNAVDSTVNVLQSEYENVSSAQSKITDADFAKETAELTRQQILQQAAQSAFALAGQSSQSVLQLINNIR